MAKLIVALPEEARPWIEAWNLKRESALGKFPVYSNSQVALVVSGVGKIASTLATSLLLQEYPLRQEEVVVNFGIAGAGDVSKPMGKLYSILKIQDQSSGRYFFPDKMLSFGSNDLYTSCSTFDKPVLREGATSPWRHFVTLDEAEAKKHDLVEMEASGFFSSALHFVPSHRIGVWKVVSDHLQGTFCSKEELSSHLWNASKVVEDWIFQMESMILHQSPKNKNPQWEDLQDRLNRISFALRLTKTQSHELMSLSKSYLLRTKKPLDFLDAYQEADVKEKHQSKKVFQEIRNALLG